MNRIKKMLSIINKSPYRKRITAVLITCLNDFHLPRWIDGFCFFDRNESLYLFSGRLIVLRCERSKPVSGRFVDLHHEQGMKPTLTIS